MDLSFLDCTHTPTLKPLSADTTYFTLCRCVGAHSVINQCSAVQGTLHSGREEEPRTGESVTGSSCSSDNIIAHFMAHSEPILAVSFDPSGMLLLTADKRGHDFHVFRIHPHPGGSSLAAVHHLYVLHRGDTTAKVCSFLNSQFNKCHITGSFFFFFGIWKL